jgi:hypothetical protein
MARERQDREELLAEATALVERAELMVEGESQPVIAGFRRDGCLSLFFGPERVYQFNTRHALRRAYVAEKLYKAEKGRLVALDRRREAGAVYLVRHELDQAESERFLDDMIRRLNSLLHALAGQRFTVAGQVPVNAAVAERVRDWLAEHANNIRIAISPHAR